MRTFKYLLVAAVAIPAAVVPAFAQTARPANPAANEQAAKVAPKSLAGVLVAFDQTARTVTVKHMVDGKPTQVTFGVQDSAVSALSQFKPGDPVKVTYVEMGDKRIIRGIVKG
jgi:Cu/Ag efflux protein CusF